MKRLTVLPFILACLALPGCRESPPGETPASPTIISFSPALTQILFDMGLGDHVIAVTGQCILPPGQARPSVGDMLRVESEQILALKPDLLLVQSKLEAFESIQQLSPGIRVEHFAIESLDDIAAAIRRLGALAGRADLGEQAAERFAARLAAVRQKVGGLEKPRVLFVLGYEKPAVPGDGTFIGEIIELAGGINAGDPGKPHPLWRQMDIEGIMAAQPDVIVCQAAPSRAEAARDYWLAVPGLPAAQTGRVYTVTDRRWSIPSTFSAVVAEQLAGMIHPELTPGTPSP